MRETLLLILSFSLIAAGCSTSSPVVETPTEQEIPSGEELSSTQTIDETGTVTIELFWKEEAVGSIEKPRPTDGYDVYLFDQQNDYAYIAVNPTGLGGYILYRGAFSLYQLDLNTHELTTLKYDGLATDIAPDDQSFASVAGSEGVHVVAVQEISTGEVVYQRVPDEFDEVGDATFSPDGTKLAYQATIKWNEARPEETAVFVVNLTTGEQTEYARQKGLFVIEWQDNETPISKN